MIEFLAKINLSENGSKFTAHLDSILAKSCPDNEILAFNDDAISIDFAGDKRNFCKKKVNHKTYYSFSNLTYEDETIIKSKLGKYDIGNFSTSESMLTYFLEYGSEGFSRLKDDFCFFLFDDTKKKLSIYRDHVGFQNYYVFKHNESIFLSSNFKNITSLPIKNFSLNHKKIRDFLSLEDFSKTNTFFNEVFKVASGTELHITKESQESKVFSKLSSTNISENELIKKNLEDEFKKAVMTHHNKALDKVGFLFSGGLDSSSVLSMFNRHKASNQKLYAFSATFSNIDENIRHLIDETEFQKEVMSGKNIENKSFSAESLTTLSDLDYFLEILGQPFFFPNLYIPAKAFKEAKKNNINTVLNGNDGDSVLSHGYEYFVELFLSLRWPSLFKNIKDTSIKRKKSKIFIFKRAVIDQLIFNGAFFSGARKRHEEVLLTSLHSNAIETQSRIASFLGVKEHYPFYSKRFIEYCVSIPAKLKNRKGYSRYIFREAMKDILPKKTIIRGTKSNLGHALCLNYRDIDKDLIEMHLRDPHEELKNLIDIKKLRISWRELLSSPRKFSTRSNIPSKVFAFVVMNRWLQLND
tara:strand:- start:1150 stop:2895 length:1746 start_codon:yes stop_codon:yes gene_type:complete